MSPLFVLRTIMISILAAIPSSCALAASWQDVVREGRVAVRNGDEERGMRLIEQGIDAAKKAGANGLQLAPVYLDLAQVEIALNKTDEARAALDAAINDATAAGGGDSEQLIPIYKQSAKLFYRQKDFIKAQAAAKDWLRLERACCEPGSEKLLASMNVAIAAACAQDRCADTGALLTEQLEIRKKHLGAEHPHVAVSLCLLGELAEKKGNWQAAESLYKEALAIRKKVEPNLVSQTEKNLVRVKEKAKASSG